MKMIIKYSYFGWQEVIKRLDSKTIWKINLDKAIKEFLMMVMPSILTKNVHD